VQTFDLTVPVPVVAGQKYTWELGGATDMYFATTDVYAGGRAAAATQDLMFHAWVAPCRVCYAPPTDISQEQADDFTSLTPWQSFTPTVSGELVQLDMRPNAFGGISGKLSVYAGEGTSGSLLHSQDYSIASVGSLPWQTFVLATPVLVQAGQKYTWELTGANGIYYATSDVYAGGRASFAGYDMTFHAKVSECH
jgi:hypothetical protein